MTEHAAVIFVFFFLAEYASIVFMCILISILFLGGYLYNIMSLFWLWDVNYDLANLSSLSYTYSITAILLENLIYALSLGLKTCIMVFVFIWTRASFPRIRYDQLMSYCWTILLPLVISFVIVVPCLLFSFDIIPLTISLI